MTDPAQASPTPEIKPCPFCGSSEDIYIDKVTGRMPQFYPIVKCGDCGNRGLPAYTEADAIAAWNMRPAILQSDQQQAELLRHAEAMAGALEPFASTAKHDIGADECDEDRHIHMERHNIADRLTVGDFRQALTVYREYQKGPSDG